MIDRRRLIQAGVFGLGAMALPGVAGMFLRRGFTHGVASGEPSANSVLLWTRFVGDADAKLRAEIASDAMFQKLVAGAEVVAAPDRDYTAKVVVKGLAPGRWYYYRFVAPDGTRSVVGRTRTLPTGSIDKFGIGLFSCANLPFGWFNAYAHACERNDLDLIVHVGDYLYEYAIGTYPSVGETLAGRVIEPAHEMVTLADYRLRYASYRLDPDLQKLHQSYPMIPQWDDHELTNDAWVGGAENHQSDKEGDWETRKAIAERVYREWMPVSDDRFGAYQIGDLATLFKLETRISGRSAPPDLEAAVKDKPDLAKALMDFRDGVLRDSARTLLGLPQEAWLKDRLTQSTKAGTRWQIISQQIVMGEIVAPQQVGQWLPEDAPEFLKRRMAAGLVAAKLGLPYNFDSWGGFPAARMRLLQDSLDAGANPIVLAGDSHNAWAQNLPLGNTAAGVEFATHSVTSPGFESLLSGIAPADLAAALRKANPELAFSDTSQRGYTSLQFTPDAVTGRFHFLRTIRERNTAMNGERRLSAQRGEQLLREI
jgi:alkaline phosphatase D